MTLPLGTDSAFFLDLYARYRRDPLSVPADWRIHFEELDAGEKTLHTTSDDLARRLVEAYRRDGHLEAELDPLDLEVRPSVPILDRLRREIETMPEQEATVALQGKTRILRLGALAAEFHELYAGSVGVEASQVNDEEARDWIHATFETIFAAPPSPDLAARALEAIALADTFETFLRTKFPSKKRFGIEGAEGTIVFLRELLRDACLAGFDEAALGGMHRGRLATLATVFGKPVGVLLAEFKGRDLTNGGPDFTGDVPYHLGYSGELVYGDRRMNISISPHPSHLMTVAPVVMGLVRAKRRSSADNVLCLLLHTDAAFSGQGLTSEVLQLGGLNGYDVGGTIHLVVNNQIGFTTTTAEGRSSRYCTDIGKAVGAPVLHVNGDDPVAVARVAGIALAWRRRYRRDILIDLVCYRRNGHNEMDEPRFTQPKVWAAVDRIPSLRKSFASSIGQSAPAVRAKTDEIAAQFRVELERGYEGIEGLRPNESKPRAAGWGAILRADADGILKPVETGVNLDTLREIGRTICTIPPTVNAHPKVARFYRARLDTIETGNGLNLATAEALAFSSLLAEGVPVRLSGQDSVRGTFSQRHLAVHDMMTGATVVPLAAAATDGASFEPINSPLSEYAVLGFEYGHSLADPERLTLWEAQFGDFLNGAQTIVDQFIVSAEAKWEMKSGLVMLLPHGLEGQGPDHSSARIERLLQLCAGGNVIVANPSTPANLFHLLRRQIVAPWRKPLFVIAPKSLLRQKACVSSLDDLGPGKVFNPVIGDEGASAARRIVLCSGKIAYALIQMRATLGLDREVAIVRLEQLYPFPARDLSTTLSRYGATEWLWCQEEPENQGALTHVLDHMRRQGITGTRAIRTVARPLLPVAAGGAIERHEIEQEALIRRALDDDYMRTGDAGVLRSNLIAPPIAG